MQTLEEQFLANATGHFVDQAAQGVPGLGMSLPRAFPLQSTIAGGGSPLSMMARAAQIMAASSSASAASQPFFRNTMAVRAAANHAANLEMGNMLAAAARRRDNAEFLAQRPNITASASPFNLRENCGNQMIASNQHSPITHLPRESSLRPKQTHGSSSVGDSEGPPRERIKRLEIPPVTATLPSMARMQLSKIDPSAIHDHDVLCGRGGGTNNHPGNESFRVLVASQKVVYLHSAKRNKPMVSRGIVRAVRNQDPPGRFLQRDEASGLWFDIGDQKAREKTAQALREGAPEIRRELTTTIDPSANEGFQIPRPLDAEVGTKRDDPSAIENDHQAVRIVPNGLSFHGSQASNQGSIQTDIQRSPNIVMEEEKIGPILAKQTTEVNAPSHIDQRAALAKLQHTNGVWDHNVKHAALHQVVPRDRWLGFGRGAPMSAYERLGPSLLGDVGLKSIHAGSIVPAVQELPSQSLEQSRKRSRGDLLEEHSSNRDLPTEGNFPFLGAARNGDTLSGSQLSHNYARRLLLAEAVAQMTVLGNLDQEWEAEEYRVGLYLDAGLLNIDPELIVKSHATGKTECDIVEEAYAKLGDHKRCSAVLPKCRKITHTSGAYKALGALTKTGINEALQFISGRGRIKVSY